MVVSKQGKLLVFDSQGRHVEVPNIEPAQPDLTAHHQNFLDAIRTDAPLAAEPCRGHVTASLCHLGKVATRVQRCWSSNPRPSGSWHSRLPNISWGVRIAYHWAVPHSAIVAS